MDNATIAEMLTGYPVRQAISGVHMAMTSLSHRHPPSAFAPKTTPDRRLATAIIRCIEQWEQNPVRRLDDRTVEKYIVMLDAALTKAVSVGFPSDPMRGRTLLEALRK